MLGVFAEFETNLRHERQLEGIAMAKAAGVCKGRPASIDPNQVRKLKADGMGSMEIAKALKIGRASVYRALAQSFSGIRSNCILSNQPIDLLRELAPVIRKIRVHQACLQGDGQTARAFAVLRPAATFFRSFFHGAPHGPFERGCHVNFTSDLGIS
jgi:Helix-turn-helix domain of resolvase